MLNPIGVSCVIAASLRRAEDTANSDGQGGIEDTSLRRCCVSTLTIGMDYLVGGLVLMLPYFFIAHARRCRGCESTRLVLRLGRGARDEGRGVLGGRFMWCAMSTMLVASGAAARAAYGVVVLIEGGKEQT